MVGGQATVILELDPGIDGATVTAKVGTVTDSTTIEVLHPSLEVLVVPDRAMIYSGEDVTYTYYLTNSGDVALSGVKVEDDNGTPGDGVIVCSGITLGPGEATTCSYTATRYETTTSKATARGQDPLGNELRHDQETTVVVQPLRVYLPAVLAGASTVQ